MGQFWTPSPESCSPFTKPAGVLDCQNPRSIYDCFSVPQSKQSFPRQQPQPIHFCWIGSSVASALVTTPRDGRRPHASMARQKPWQRCRRNVIASSSHPTNHAISRSESSSARDCCPCLSAFI